MGTCRSQKEAAHRSSNSTSSGGRVFCRLVPFYGKSRASEQHQELARAVVLYR